MNLDMMDGIIRLKDLSVTERMRMYLRNSVRRALRFPLLPLTLVALIVLFQIHLHVKNGVVDSTHSKDYNLPPAPPQPESPLLFNPTHQRQLRDGVERCPDLRRPEAGNVKTRNGYWQYHESNEIDEIIVYSAYFDDRPALELSTWIRVLGIARLSSEGLNCHLWYEDHEAPFVTPALLNLTGRKVGYTHKNKTYVQYLISCSVPGIEPVPSHISLVKNECESSTIYLPVQRPIKSTPDQKFGVCVPISFGTVPVPVFVEWIEYTNLLGVTEFNVYDANMTGMSEAFKYYSDRGLLRVSRIPPAIDLFDLNGIKLSSAVSLNDCMLRNLYRYELILVIDFDEIIIPKMHPDYLAMFDDINRKKKRPEPYRNIAFQNAYFFLETTQDTSEPWYLLTARHRGLSRVKKYTVNPKSFIDPRHCLSVFNHYCYISLHKSPYNIDIHPSIAVTHHYRKCGFVKSRCQEYFNATTRDDTALRFKDKLLPRVTSALKDLRVPLEAPEVKTKL